MRATAGRPRDPTGWTSYERPRHEASLVFTTAASFILPTNGAGTTQPLRTPGTFALS
jgi:hypothetical protein